MNTYMPSKTFLISLFLFLCIVAPLSANAAGASSADAGIGSISLSEEEAAYLDRAGEITIGYPINDCPMFFQNQKTGQLEGIIIDILNMISETTGLTFRYEALPSGSITYNDLRRLEVDMVAGVELNHFNERSIGLVLTDTYLHAAKVFVCKEGVEFSPDSAMTIAVSSGSQTLERVIRQQYPMFQILFCDSTEAALSALLSGKADAVLQNQYIIERILRKPVYEDLRIVATASIGDSQCLACLVPIGEDGQNVVSDDVATLLSIINKGIAALDQSRVAFSIIRETSENAYQFTIGDMLYRYRFTMAFVLASVLLIIVLLRKNHVLQKKRKEQIEAQRRAKELSAINAQMKEQQLLLMDALKRAEEGNQAKNSFLFNMSHDIRTPMNAILGFTEIAQRNISDTVRLTDCLEKIQTSGKHLLHLINDILDMTKIESGKVTLTEEGCNLRESVYRARNILQAEIEKKRLTLRIDMSGIKNDRVYCDTLRFDQILYNLLSNAVKFTRPDGRIRIELNEKPCAIQEYAVYELRVKDTGIGMSPEFLSRLFEPFERERTSTISQTEGTGLGLCITKKLVDLMGGSIQVTSELDQGTEFVLSFTFKLQRQTEYQTTEAVFTDDFSGRRLLLVEDNELNMEIAQELLREAGFLVETAFNGQAAVEMVRASTAGYYDAILMDIQMPVMDGYQASQEIRGLENKELAEIPIIALTANAFDEDKKEALSHGMNAHIAKPLDIVVLCEVLKRLLREKRNA